MSDLQLRLLAADSRVSAAIKERSFVLTKMVNAGMAKIIEDRDDCHNITVVARPEILAEIDSFEWGEFGPEYYDSEDEIVVVPPGYRVEWY